MKKLIELTDCSTYPSENKILIRISSIISIFQTPNNRVEIVFKDRKTILVKENLEKIKTFLD